MSVQDGPRVVPADSVKLCNCAGCGQPLLGESMAGMRVPAKVRHPPLAGRLGGRPYCAGCLRVRLACGKVTPE